MLTPSTDQRTKPTKRLFLWLAVAVLLIAALASISHADALSIWSDESYSIFHTSGSLEQIIREPDTAWPPGYYMTLYLWSHVASQNDFSLHILGVCLGLLTTAFLIRIGQQLFSPAAGLLTALAYSTSSYALYFILELRGYTLMLFAEALFLFCYLRWRKRPTLRRSAALLIAQVLIVYVQFWPIVAILLAGFHVLITAPRKFLRWLIIFAFTLIAFLPLLPQLLKGFRLRAGTLNQPLPNYYLYNFDSFYRAFSAHWDIWFGMILVVVLAGLIHITLRAAKRFDARTLLWLLIWGIGIPVAAYLTKERTAAFTTRYLLFTIPATFALIGIGLAALPRQWIGAGALLILALAPWQPYDHRPQASDAPPVKDFMRAMSQDFQPGDRLVVDPNCQCQDPISWWYYQGLYFPHGDLSNPGNNLASTRRVWYLVRQGSEDKTLLAAVQKGRLMQEFWGPWYFIATLYEAPPLTPGIRIGDSLRFRGADVDRHPVLHAGDTLKLRLWWSTDQPLPRDYSITIQLIDPAGKVVAQLDGPPKTPGTPEQLSAWTPDTIYRDERQLAVPYQLHDGEYTLQLAVYQWWDQVRLEPESGTTPQHTVIIDRAILDSFGYW